jgi:hypothetical protein
MIKDFSYEMKAHIQGCAEILQHKIIGVFKIIIDKTTYNYD